MPISLQADATLPQGYILVNGEKVASVSTTGGLSATLAANTVTTSSLVSGSVTTEKIAPGAVITEDLANGAVTPQKLSQPFTLATAKAFNWNGSSSNTFIDFENIPSWVKRVTVIFNGVSTNGTSPVLTQLGTSSGIQTTGYNYNLLVVAGVNICSTTGFTTGFAIVGSTAASARVGHIVITNITGNTWVAAANSHALTSDVGAGSGALLLSNSLNRIRITTVNGIDTFDGGTINISYEG